MKIHRRTILTTCSVLAAVAMSAPHAAHADDPTPTPQPRGYHVGYGPENVTTHTFAGQSGAAEYWTADRMRKAKDLTRIAPKKPANASPVEPAGAPTVVEGQAPTVRQATPESPKATIGKVFFTMGGSDYVCSANSVKSPNASVVATAGHCANEGPGAYATRFIFVPAYQNGSAPYGRWTATSVSTPTQWSSQGDINYDTAFVTVGTLGGSTLAARVGATGVAFNQAKGQNYAAYGYPAGAPFDGETLKSCRGTATPDPYGKTSQGIPCDMTGGSSGGPWFLGSGYNGASSVQNSVNSYGYDGTAKMFGPYWGSVVQQSYTAAGSR